VLFVFFFFFLFLSIMVWREALAAPRPRTTAALPRHRRSADIRASDHTAHQGATGLLTLATVAPTNRTRSQESDAVALYHEALAEQQRGDSEKAILIYRKVLSSPALVRCLLDDRRSHLTIIPTTAATRRAASGHASSFQHGIDTQV
jgi:hypothetical protein